MSAAMKPDLRWRAILAAYEDIDRLIAQAVAVGGDGARTALAEARDQARTRLADLRSELAEVLSREQVMLLLVIAIDERVMNNLPESLRFCWVPLQREWLGSTDGGDAFYRMVQSLLEDGSTPVVVFEVAYFCLINGFVGRYAGDPDAIAAFAERLRQRIPVPASWASEPSAEWGGAVDAESGYGVSAPSLRSRSVLWYYVITAVVVVSITLLLVESSNVGS